MLMTVDILEAMERDERAMERIATAAESIAEALTMWCKLEQQRFDREYPVKTPRDAIVTHVKTPEEILRENIGGEPEPLEEWIGPREQELLKKAK